MAQTSYMCVTAGAAPGSIDATPADFLGRAMVAPTEKIGLAESAAFASGVLR